MSSDKKGGKQEPKEARAAPAPKDAAGSKGGNKGNRGPNNRSGNSPVIGAHLQRPSKEETNVKVKANIAMIAEYNDRIKGIREEIAKINEVSKENKPEQDAAKQLMSALQAERKQYMDERAAIIAERDAMKAAQETLRNAETRIRGDLKFKDVEALDAHLEELERKQSTTSMTLTAEKNLLKEIKALQDARKRFAELGEVRQQMERGKSSRADFDRRYSEKMAQVDEVSKRVAAQRAAMDKIFGVNSEARETIPGKYKAIDEIRALITEKRDEIQALESEFKAQEDAYFAALKEERRKAEEARQAEIERKKAEKEAKEKEALEAELRKVPFEEEINLCDSTVAYLEKKVKVYDTFLQLSMRASAAAAPAATTAPAGSESSDASVMDNGKVLKLLKRDDYDEQPVGKAAKAGKKGGNKKKGSAMALGSAPPAAAATTGTATETTTGAAAGSATSDAVSHDVAQTGIFTFLTVTPPSTIAQIATAIEDIRKRKEYYQSQERNAPGVQTYVQFLKKEEKKTAATQQGAAATAATGEKKKGRGRGDDAAAAVVSADVSASASADAPTSEPTKPAAAAGGKKAGGATTVFTVEQLQSADLFPTLTPVAAAPAAGTAAAAVAGSAATAEA